MAGKRSLTPLILLLFVLTLLAGTANFLVFFDLPWFRTPSGQEDMYTHLPEDIDEEVAESLRSAVFLVQVPRCDGQGYATGTSFLIDDRYAVTCSHVVGDNLSCESEIRVINSDGIDQVVVLEAYSNNDDLALLRLSNSEGSPLSLANSSQYEESEDVLRVYTLGYPLLGAASTSDEASFSGIGTISQFDESRGVFITSGLNINPGNSGGPVLFEDERLVLGVACSRLDSSVAEGIGFVIPSDRLRDFFAANTGQSLP